MESPGQRLPRARNQAACIPCRRRKSRCKFEPAATQCLMCKSHSTECVRSHTSGNATGRVVIQRRQERLQAIQSPRNHTVHRVRSPPLHNAVSPSTPSATNLSRHGLSEQQAGPTTVVSLDVEGDDNPHIVGPASASDSHFIDDYLSSIHARDGGRVIRPSIPGTLSAPVVFMRVKKRPVGLSMDPNPSTAKLHTIVKLLEPHQDAVIRSYFARGNICFPVLRENFFAEQTTRSRISPAVLACLYAHALCYWDYDAELRSHHRPDERFIWNLALEALYSELHLSPGMPSVIAILLNIGGRPTTTIVGNGMLLGCAISLAQSLGLNLSPLSWDITEQEKTFRMNIWWCLMIHDRWMSLTHGTPPHIRQSHYNVPLPSVASADGPTRIFQALSGLSTVVGIYLEQLYSINEATRTNDPAFKLSDDLDAWTDMLVGDIRRIIIRGTDLDVPGAANLRLCFLAAKFFSHRLELNSEVDNIASGQPLTSRMLTTRRSVEEIVLFVRELDSKQLGDFWLPAAAFVFSSATTFLIRLAIQAEIAADDTPRQSLSLSLAHDLISSLRAHKQSHRWDLGDLCLTQYAEIVDKLWGYDMLPDLNTSWLDSAAFYPDVVAIDAMLEDVYDTLGWAQSAREDRESRGVDGPYTGVG